MVNGENKPELYQNPIPTLRSVIESYNDVLGHNCEHTGLDPLIRALSRANDGGSGDFPELVEAAATRGDMDADLQEILHGDVFTRIGIRLTPYGPRICIPEGACASQKLVPIIDDVSKYCEFLAQQVPWDFDPDVPPEKKYSILRAESATDFLADVVATLEDISSTCFTPNTSVDITDEERQLLAETGEDSLRAFTLIDPEYTRLWVNAESLRTRYRYVHQEDWPWDQVRNYDKMTSRVVFWGRNLLPEYMIAEHSEYLADPKDQRSGPATWHTSRWQENWAKAFDFIQELEADIRTIPFAAEVKAGLVISIDEALANISEDDVPKIKDQRADLENVRNALCGQPYDRDRLTDYATGKTVFSMPEPTVFGDN